MLREHVNVWKKALKTRTDARNDRALNALTREDAESREVVEAVGPDGASIRAGKGEGSASRLFPGVVELENLEVGRPLHECGEDLRLPYEYTFSHSSRRQN